MSQFLKVTLQGVQILPQLNFTHIKSFSSKFKQLFSLIVAVFVFPDDVRVDQWVRGLASPLFCPGGMQPVLLELSK